MRFNHERFPELSSFFTTYIFFFFFLDAFPYALSVLTVIASGGHSAEQL